MKAWLAVITLLVTLNCYAQDGALWKHVYRPDRLKVNTNSITVTGTVKKIKHEKDGDLHINIKLDAAYAGKNFTNKFNNTKQHGCLVIEIICVYKPVQSDAIAPCTNYSNLITVPKKGDHIKVSGTYITDTEANHGWNEIHPVAELVVLKK
jgi:hypothetical protein